ncbi:unnamed protein product [Paramecium sonneborni]|uniref:Transmembrane protein n=1 Tax=Paramecium sonneborni TaxID=65129 RepID=A0A8S1RP94_9CILI|nr:unnamed protein product [Paramecium sonneborni]
MNQPQQLQRILMKVLFLNQLLCKQIQILGCQNCCFCLVGVPLGMNIIWVFLIYGKKNFINPSRLEMGSIILYQYIKKVLKINQKKNNLKS